MKRRPLPLDDAPAALCHLLQRPGIFHVGLKLDPRGSPRLEVKVDRGLVSDPRLDLPSIPDTLRHLTRSPDGSVAEIEIPVSVVTSAPARLLSYDNYVRPVYGGFKIAINEGWWSYGAGTLGVNIQWNGKYRLLTNYHVLAQRGQITKGKTVYQPEPGSTKYRFTEVSGGWPVTAYSKNGRHSKPKRNKYDFAWCDVEQRHASPHIAIIGLPRGIRAPKRHEKVMWVGQKTGRLQQATIQGTTDEMVVPWGGQQCAYFRNVMTLIGGKAQEGDSGAAVVAVSDKKVVGLMTGGPEEEEEVYALRIPEF